MTIREAININQKVGLALYSSQIDPNLAICHDFSLNNRGRARGVIGVKSSNLWYLLAIIIKLSSVTCSNIVNMVVNEAETSYRTQFDDNGE